MSDSLWPQDLQHDRFPCPSPTPRASSNSCPLSQWYHSTVSSSTVPFSSCLQSFPASGSFQMSQFFTSGGQSIGASASASVLPMNTQDWLPLGWTGWISLKSKGLSRVFSNTKVQKHQFFHLFWTLDLHKVDGLHEPGLGGQHTGVQAAPGHGDALATPTVGDIGVQCHIVNVKAHAPHVLLAQCPLLGGPLEARHHTILDFIEVLHAPGDVREDAGAHAVRAKAPDLAGLATSHL